jgi:signal transduction histidine kinase
LSNAVRHSEAKRVEVWVSVSQGMLHLMVKDDGVGLAPDQTRRSGLRNMARRAAALGGTFEVFSGEDGGTQLDWQVPV